MDPSRKERAGMLSRDPRWVKRLRESQWRHKFTVWFALGWLSLIVLLWLLNDLVT